MYYYQNSVRVVQIPFRTVARQVDAQPARGNRDFTPNCRQEDVPDLLWTGIAHNPGTISVHPMQTLMVSNTGDFQLLQEARYLRRQPAAKFVFCPLSGPSSSIFDRTARPNGHQRSTCAPIQRAAECHTVYSRTPTVGSHHRHSRFFCHHNRLAFFACSIRPAFFATTQPLL